MKTTKLLLMAFAFLSLLSCDYEKPELLPAHNVPVTPGVPNPNPDPENPPPTSQEFKALYTQALEDLTQEFTLDAAQSTVTFTSAKGVTLTLYPSCFTKNGNPVTGEVTVEYIEMFDRGSMLTTNKPTMGTMPDGKKGLLISGGEFYINATQNGVQLQTNCSMQLMIPTSLTGGGDTQMTLWAGRVDADGNLVWAENENATGQENGVFVEGNNYYCYFDRFGWTNVDRFYNDPRPKTTIYVDAPEGYDNTNSAVFLAYAGETNSLALLDTYDETTGLFSEHYGLIPIGLECYVIFVSEDDGDWTYAIKHVTIIANHIIVIDEAELSTVSQDDLLDAIDALP